MRCMGLQLNQALLKWDGISNFFRTVAQDRLVVRGMEGDVHERLLALICSGWFQFTEKHSFCHIAKFAIPRWILLLS